MLVNHEQDFCDNEGILRRLKKWGLEWGKTCTATDFDFLLLEYEYGTPKAIIEYKHEYAKAQYPTSPQYQALIKLGNKAEIPVLACRYSEDYSSYNVVPLNDYAKKFVPERKKFDERGWITLLYEMKGHKVTAEFLKNMEVEI